MKKFKFLLSKIFDWQTLSYILITAFMFGIVALSIVSFKEVFYFGAIIFTVVSSLLVWVWSFRIMPTMVEFWFGGWQQFRKTEIIEGHETSHFKEYFSV